MLGFVEELIVNDDPEYQVRNCDHALFAVSHSRTQWIDKIRTMRASNMARQGVLSKVSGELQRKIGLKVGDASCEP